MQANRKASAGHPLRQAAGTATSQGAATNRGGRKVQGASGSAGAERLTKTQVQHAHGSTGHAPFCVPGGEGAANSSVGGAAGIPVRSVRNILTSTCSRPTSAQPRTPAPGITVKTPQYTRGGARKSISALNIGSKNRAAEMVGARPVPKRSPSMAASAYTERRRIATATGRDVGGTAGIQRVAAGAAFNQRKVGGGTAALQRIVGATTTAQRLVGTVNTARRGDAQKAPATIQEKVNRLTHRVAAGNKDKRPEITIEKYPIPKKTKTEQKERPGNTLKEIERLREGREQRRLEAAAARLELDKLRKESSGKPNWEFDLMIREKRKGIAMNPIVAFDDSLLREQPMIVCVRKRPLGQREVDNMEIDVISVPTPSQIILHQPRTKLDTTKYIEDQSFSFDYSFGEGASNWLIYCYACYPLVASCLAGGTTTLFAYGQTGAGKTHLMQGAKLKTVDDPGLYALTARDLIDGIAGNEMRLEVYCSFFEIHGTSIYDLLAPGRPEIKLLEDDLKVMQLVGLSEFAVNSADEVLELVRMGSKVRVTRQTVCNDASSRSHAIFLFKLRKEGSSTVYGTCLLADLAGNERGAENMGADKTSRLESSEINKSLLALKECIRCYVRNMPHLPFRDSKLTQVLRESFVPGTNNRTCMIALVSPGFNSCDYTLDTLRYAQAAREVGNKCPTRSFAGRMLQPQRR